ncbi:hypothetical protein [Motilibacter aurantiacus]|uniref:hypothetical protein n=1 Tax=Motilibacter aurantiacus TaxID=2714955 RepID=UPI001407B7C2|nr:hypothetical protein [Motilibacter aurantiacus]NHC47425.1 hypothetical protein [Motilibacter aurantiacus]
MLAAPGGSPRRADALAAEAGVRPDDPRRGAALAEWLLVRAARDGHTWAPEPVLRSALSALEVHDPAAALGLAGDLGAVVAPADGALALTGLALVEEEAAEEVERLLVTGGTVRCAVGPDGPARDAAAPAARAHTVQADRLDAAALRDLAAEVEDGEDLVLAGDPALLPGGTGQVLRDLLRSGVVDVAEADGPPHPGVPEPLARLRLAVRNGELPPPGELTSPGREVVVVPAPADEHVVAKVVQLVGTSIPRAFGTAPDRVRVVTPLARGAAGARALTQALGREVTTVADTAGTTWDALVLVLPGSSAGALSRELVLTALAGARRHVSVVTSVGPALPRAVARVPARPRRSRLAGLLAGG